MTYLSPVAPGSDAAVNAVIASLTYAARHTHVVGAGSAQAHLEPVNAPEMIARVVTSVAANLGGLDRLLAGRPGSWEADLVRQLVAGTVPEEQLPEFRTEPVYLVLDVDEAFSDLGLAALYDQEYDTAATALATFEELTAQRPDDPTSWRPSDVATAARLVDCIEEVLERDVARYRADYAATAARLLRERGGTVHVVVVTPQQAASSMVLAADGTQQDAIAESLADAAREFTPLPMTGRVPDWSNGSPADAVLAEGLTYTARAILAMRASDRAAAVYPPAAGMGPAQGGAGVTS